MAKRKFFILPATSPEHTEYGAPGDFAVEGAAVHHVSFDREVWYTLKIRAEVFKQIGPELADENWLIGFSKSGFGALNLLIDAPDLFAGVVVFDVPLTLKPKPWWVNDEFYDEEQWLMDLPMNRVEALAEISQNLRLLHISGTNFHQQHQDWDLAMREAGASLEFHPRPEMKHHWESGWWDLVLEYVLQ